jgi:hypothetical protein
VPSQEGLWLKDDRSVEKAREQAVEVDQDQAVRRSQLGSGRRRALQDDELLPEIDNLGLTFRRRATQPSDQGRDKSQKMGHRTGSLPDSKRVARLDKIIGSDNRLKQPD